MGKETGKSGSASHAALGKTPGAAGKDAQAERRARAAEALRANLRRRKAQPRERDAAAGSTPQTSPEDS